jgi:hypothetical protein
MQKPKLKFYNMPPEAVDLIANASSASILHFQSRGATVATAPVAKPTAKTEIIFVEGEAWCLEKFLDKWLKA